MKGREKNVNEKKGRKSKRNARIYSPAQIVQQRRECKRNEMKRTELKRNETPVFFARLHETIQQRTETKRMELKRKKWKRIARF